MIIDLPFRYSVEGIAPGRRNANTYTSYGTVAVDIPDVSSDDVSVALEVLDEDGVYKQKFLKYREAFYIRDRATEDEPFGKQHLLLIGRWPQKAASLPVHTRRQVQEYREFTKTQAAAANAQMIANLGAVGLLQRETVSAQIYDNATVTKHGDYVEVDGRLWHALESCEDDLKTVNSTDRSARRNDAERYALDNAIALDGELWHKVPEPVIAATKDRADWIFSESFERLSQSSSYEDAKNDRWTQAAYRLSMAEHDDLYDAFPGLSEKSGIKFYIEHIDTDCFDRPDLRAAIAKDIEDAMLASNRVGFNETPYVIKWCELRDLLKDRGTDYASIGEEVLDHAAEIMGELDALKDKVAFPGAQMWRGRKVDLNFGHVELASPTP